MMQLTQIFPNTFFQLFLFMSPSVVLDVQDFKLGTFVFSYHLYK